MGAGQHPRWLLGANWLLGNIVTQHTTTVGNLALTPASPAAIRSTTYLFHDVCPTLCHQVCSKISDKRLLFSWTFAPHLHTWEDADHILILMDATLEDTFSSPVVWSVAGAVFVQASHIMPKQWVTKGECVR